jgi:hypothetical protein
MLLGVWVGGLVVGLGGLGVGAFVVVFVVVGPLLGWLIVGAFVTGAGVVGIAPAEAGVGPASVGAVVVGCVGPLAGRPPPLGSGMARAVAALSASMSGERCMAAATPVPTRATAHTATIRRRVGRATSIDYADRWAA